MSSAVKRVLLVEDEYLVAMLTEDMLTDIGFTVGSIVATVEAGVSAASNEMFDAAVLDVNLRGQMSFPIADVLAAKGVPFIFASGYSAMAIEPRFADVVRLQKPFSTEALEKAMNKAVSGSSND